jgi:hypothetical protein
MSKEFLHDVRYALDKVAQDAFEVVCLKIEEEMKSLEEARDRFGSLDNYHIPDASAFRLNLQLQEERIIMSPTYSPITRLMGDEVHFLTHYANFVTGVVRNTEWTFHGKKLIVPRYDIQYEDFEDEAAVYPAPGYDVCYRDEEGVFHSLRRTHERRNIIYNDDTPYLVTYGTTTYLPIFTADEKRQIVRCTNLWTKEQKVYVFPCPPPREDSSIHYLSHFFMFGHELHAFGDGKKIYHVPSNRLVAELGEEIMMDNVRSVAGDGRHLVVSQYNRYDNSELLRYVLSR